MAEESKTILIVDDEEEIVSLLSDHFSRQGFAVIASTDPATVLDKLKNIRISLLLVDLKMRTLDGLELLQKIRGQEHQPEAVIVMTGFLPKYEDRLREFGIPAEDVITKPFDFEKMEHAIGRKLGTFPSEGAVEELAEGVVSNKKTALVFIEDEKPLLECYLEFFEGRGFDVRGFLNGQDALQALKARPARIVFVDMNLPGMRGEQIVAELGKLSPKPAVIIVSADPPFGEQAEKLKKLGCRAIFDKPFHIQELMKVVTKLSQEKL